MTILVWSRMCSGYSETISLVTNYVIHRALLILSLIFFKMFYHVMHMIIGTCMLFGVGHYWCVSIRITLIICCMFWSTCCLAVMLTLSSVLLEFYQILLAIMWRTRYGNYINVSVHCFIIWIYMYFSFICISLDIL